jgi:nucleotide-binding universal stress UspA family protein
MRIMVYVAVAVVWLVVGAAVGLLEARHGHWRHSWVVSAILGPFALALAIERRQLTPPSPTVLTTGRARRGPVDLLLGFDGSTSSMEAAALAIGLFGPRLRRVTLATVLDVDTAAPHADSTLYPEPWPEEQAARHDLDTAVSSLEADLGIKAGSVILAGAPADALERYAIDEGYEVLVIGCRGKGLSKLLLGSCASTLACKTKVPVMLIPAAAPTTSSPSTPAPSKAPATRRHGDKGADLRSPHGG